MAAKSTWLHSLAAWLLPAVVGTAVGGGMILLLSEPDAQAKQALVMLEAAPAAVEAGVQEEAKLSPETNAPATAAEIIRPALPARPMAELPPAVEPPSVTEPTPDRPIGGLVSDSPSWRPLVDDVAARFRTEIPDLGGLPLLYYAVLTDDEEWVDRLIATGLDVNERTPGGDTALCAAIRHMPSDCVRALLSGAADPDASGYENQPPIALASLRRGAEGLRALTVAGVDPNTRFNSPVSKTLLDRVTIKDLRHALENDRGVTPLIACSARGDVEGAMELMAAGAKSSYCTTRYKRYPINFAATQGYLFLMRIILGRQPDSEPHTLVTVDLTRQRAWVMKEGLIIDSCPVSTGREGYATPAGRYVITDKHKSWTSTLYHVSMPFFMRLNCSAIGLHSGYVTGRPASHGCIRLPYEKAKKFFNLVRVGDEVQIVH